MNVMKKIQKQLNFLQIVSYSKIQHDRPISSSASIKKLNTTTN